MATCGATENHSLVRRYVSFVREVLGVEVPAPSAAAAAAPVGVVAAAATAETVLVVFVVRVGHDFVGHVFLLAEELLQTDDDG